MRYQAIVIVAGAVVIHKLQGDSGGSLVVTLECGVLASVACAFVRYGKLEISTRDWRRCGAAGRAVRERQPGLGDAEDREPFGRAAQTLGHQQALECFLSIDL
jgi:hypothetical protein